MKGHWSEETVDLRDRKWIQSAQRGAVPAANEAGSSEAAVALEKLCRAYWYPLYALVRRRGHSVEEAQDLTQGFFLHMLEKHRLAGIDPSKGKFRSFLISAFNHFLANEWRREHAAKRGAGHPLISLDSGAADCRYSLESGSNVTPEVLYERQWAITLLENALRRLEAEFAAAGKSKHFERLKGLLTTEPERHQYGAAAADLGMTTGAVRVAICRLRHRYRALVREEIAQTVEAPGEVDEEIRWLHTVLG